MLPPCGPGEAQEVLPVLARHVRPEQLVRACEASPRDLDEPRFRDEAHGKHRGSGAHPVRGRRKRHLGGHPLSHFVTQIRLPAVGGDLACREAATHRAGDVQHHPQTARTESDPSLRWPLADSHRPLRRCWFHHGNDRAKGRKHVPASTANSSLRHLRSDRRRPRRARKHRARQRTLGASRPSEKAQARHSELSSSPSSHGKAAQCGLSRFGAGRPRVPLWLRLMHVLPPIVVSRAVLRP